MNKLDTTHIEMLDGLPESATTSLKVCAIVSTRSRATLFRDNKAGKLPFVKVGNATKVRIGDLRKYLSGEVAQ